MSKTQLEMKSLKRTCENEGPEAETAFLEEISRLKVVEIISGSGHSFFSIGFLKGLPRGCQNLSVASHASSMFFAPSISPQYIFIYYLYTYIYITYLFIHPSIHPSIFLYKNPTAVVTWSPVGESHRGSRKNQKNRSTGGKSRITSPKHWQFLITMIGSKVEKP